MEVKIVEAMKVPGMTEARVGKTDRVILYRVDGGVARYIRLPDEGFTDEKLRAAIQADLKDLTALHGKTFQV